MKQMKELMIKHNNDIILFRDWLTKQDLNTPSLSLSYRLERKAVDTFYRETNPEFMFTESDMLVLRENKKVFMQDGICAIATAAHHHTYQDILQSANSYIRTFEESLDAPVPVVFPTAYDGVGGDNSFYLSKRAQLYDASVILPFYAGEKQRAYFRFSNVIRVYADNRLLMGTHITSTRMTFDELRQLLLPMGMSLHPLSDMPDWKCSECKRDIDIHEMRCQCGHVRGSLCEREDGEFYFEHSYNI